MGGTASDGAVGRGWSRNSPDTSSATPHLSVGGSGRRDGRVFGEDRYSDSVSPRLATSRAEHERHSASARCASRRECRSGPARARCCRSCSGAQQVGCASRSLGGAGVRLSRLVRSGRRRDRCFSAASLEAWLARVFAERHGMMSLASLAERPGGPSAPPAWRGRPRPARLARSARCLARLYTRCGWRAESVRAARWARSCSGCSPAGRREVAVDLAREAGSNSG